MKSNAFRGVKWTGGEWQHELQYGKLKQHKEIKFYCEDSQTLVQVAHGGCVISVLGDTKNILNILHKIDEIWAEA